MNLEKLNPWNWFKDEDNGSTQSAQIPVTRNESKQSMLPSSNVSPLMRLHREMDRAFDDLFNSFGLSSRFENFPSLRTFDDQFFNYQHPSIDIAGDSRSYQISLDVPGLKEDEISIELEGDNLIIKGEKEERNENSDKHYYRMERRFGAFQRTLSLPNDANADDITAKLDDGVLQLEIPRKSIPRENIKRIEINS